MKKLDKEVYTLSDKDRRLIGEPIGYQIEISPSGYRAITSTGHTIRQLYQSEVTIPLGRERFYRKHYNPIHAE